jgi:UDP-galactopyranose mutase
MDIILLRGIAEPRPDWHVVMVGPVVKIDPAELSQPANIHYLRSRVYGALPTYLAWWDVALLPFARNESTRFISPTKTLEYLAGGKPVVSTAIRESSALMGRRAWSGWRRPVPSLWRPSRCP